MNVIFLVSNTTALQAIAKIGSKTYSVKVIISLSTGPAWTKIKSVLQPDLPFCWPNIIPVSPGDQASSGQSPTDSQGLDQRTEKESSHGNITVHGAPDGDEMKPSKKKKETLDSSADLQQVASYSGRLNPPSESHRVSASDQQTPAPASLKHSKEQKETLAPSMGPHQVASYSGRPNPPSESHGVSASDQQTPAPASLKGFDHRTEKESSHGNITVHGDPDGDEMKPSKKKKETLAPSMALQQVASYSGRLNPPSESHRVSASDQQTPAPASLKPSKEQIESLDSSVDLQQVASNSRTPDHPAETDRVPDSDQLPVPPSFEELMSLKVPPDLHNAAVTLAKNYHDRDNNRTIDKFFKALGKAIQEPDSAESSKSSSSRSGTVKVHKIVTGKTFGADEALLKQLNCKELQVKMTDRQGCDIIILFCSINSRVGSDVEFAMRQVSGEERVILILMHHTRDVDYSTAAKRWSETFDNVVFDINVLYHETVPGLLTCTKNTEAVSDIRKELMPYSSSTNGNMFTRNLPSLSLWWH